MVCSCGQQGAKQVVKLTAYITKPHGEGGRTLTFGTDIPERKQNATVRGEYAKRFLLSLSSAPPAGRAAGGVVPGARAPSGPGLGLGLFAERGWAGSCVFFSSAPHQGKCVVRMENQRLRGSAATVSSLRGFKGCLAPAG